MQEIIFILVALLVVAFGLYGIYLHRLITSLSNKLDKVLETAKVSEANTRLAEQNAKLTARQKEYNQVFAVILETLKEDTGFLKSSLAKRVSSWPEYSDINHQLITFENRIIHIIQVLREQRMLDDYDDEE